MNRHSLLHLLNLDAVGGVEELFTHFLERSPSVQPCDHHILVTGKKPHRFFQTRLSQCKKSLTQEKYCCGLKIPTWLRERRRKRLIASCKPDAIVLWNRLESFKQLKKIAPSSRIVYYEHGASWYEPQNSPCKEALKDVDTIIANSHAAKRLLQLKWDITSPIHVVENPLKADVLAAKAPKRAPSLTKKALHIGFAGRLIPLKGVTLLLHAVNILHKRGVPVELSIAGDGEDKVRLQQEAKRLGIDERVHFVGCIPNISQFYGKIDLLVVPSIREPLGLVAQEAALSACPVLASLVDGLPEVVLHGKTGYCLAPTLDIAQYGSFGGSHKQLPDTVYDPITDSLSKPKIVDPAVIAEHIEKLVENPFTYEALSKQALAFAKGRPTTMQYTQALLNCL
ncbi:MAG: glycosyltransferase [Verrucomicrobia bacterium]|nr:glycosyltransferase [Verrucomicrobiota bacterium]